MQVTMSYLEIYNENIRDLLDPSSGYLELRDESGGRNIQVFVHHKGNMVFCMHGHYGQIWEEVEETGQGIPDLNFFHVSKVYAFIHTDGSIMTRLRACRR